MARHKIVKILPIIMSLTIKKTKPVSKPPPTLAGSKKLCVARSNMSIENGTVRVRGYQTFSIANRKISVAGSTYPGKFNFIDRHLAETKPSSVLDLGASCGLASFMAAKNGATTVTALDYDSVNISLINKVARATGLKVDAKQWSFGDPVEPADTVIVLALIHWIFSCTCEYGNFEDIVKYLKSMTKKELIIEWVDNSDPAIKITKHTSRNPHVIKESYTVENFTNALSRHFSHVERVYEVTPHRILYICNV